MRIVRRCVSAVAAAMVSMGFVHLAAEEAHAGKDVQLRVGNLVWDDRNANGRVDPGEPGIPGVTIRVYEGGVAVPPADGGLLTTDSTGHYTYAHIDWTTDVFTRAFVIEVVTPAGCTSSPDLATSFDPDNNLDDDDNGVISSAITVRANAVTISEGGEPTDDGDDADGNMTVDFGFVCPPPPPAPPVALGNLVWHDLDNDGMVDAGEPGLAGVTVRLFAADGISQLASATTDLTGAYLFAGLAEGRYVVDVLAPAGYASSVDVATAGDPDTNVDGDDNGVGVGPGIVRSAPILLSAGTEPTTDGDADANSNLTLDFGLVRPPAPTLSVGNLVWLDANADGAHQPSEPGVSGITVRLYDAASMTLLATDTTDANGRYLFTGLDARSVAVDVAVPSGYASTVDVSTSSAPDNDIDDDDNGVVEGAGSIRSAPVVLAPGSEPVHEDGDANTNLTLDFGLVRPVVAPAAVGLGNLVWHDQNDNGSWEAGEPGLSGVTVRLFASDGVSLVGATTTDVAGHYHFANLEPGSYIVEVVAPPGAASSADVETSSAPDADVDGDDNGVVVGEATVRSLAVTLSVGGEPTSDGDDASSNQTIDFGFVLPLPPTPRVAVGNLVWHDANNNGAVDAGEAGIPDVAVRLLQADGVTLVAATTTTNTGQYLFTDLEPGTYVVEVATPSGGYVSSTDGSTTADPNNNLNNDDNGVIAGATVVRSGAILLTPGAEPATDGDADINSNLTLDFGFFVPQLVPVRLSLGNLVWRDLDDNGRADAGEPPLAGVPVALYAAGGATRLRTTMTSAAGLYVFGDLDEGTYVVEVETPAGLVSSRDVASSADPNTDVDGDDNGSVAGGGVVRSGPVTLTLGAEPTADGDADPNTNLSVDFGFAQPAIVRPALVVGNLVWNDLDEDGAVGPGEPGIPGVTVQLYQADGATLVAATTTDASGRYRFGGLDPGQFIVEALTPPGFVSTTDLASSASADSDVDGDDNGVGGAGSSVRATVVTLAAGAEPLTDGDNDADSNLTIDFGFTRPRALPALGLGNLVWIDTDDDGRVDPGEPGRSGVMLELHADADLNGVSDGGALATTSTNADGRYAFSGLAPGSYLVRVSASNFSPGGALAGYATSSGTGSPAPGPNDDVDNDDNGTAGTGFVTSGTVTLAVDSEPAADGDGDANTNLTVDFGFHAAAPDLRITLSTQGTAHAVGAIVDYFLEVTNVGSVGTQSVITLMFTLPPALLVHMDPLGTGWACRVDGQAIICTSDQPLAPGATTNVTVWTETVAVAAVVTASATVDLSGDPVVANNTGLVTLQNTSPGVPALAGADLAISQQGPARVTPGASAAYVFEIQNLGAAAATNVVFNDVLPDGLVIDTLTTSTGSCARPRSPVLTCELGTLAMGVRATVTVSAFAVQSGVLLHAGYVRSADTFDPALANNASVLATVVASAINVASLAPPDADSDGLPDDWERSVGLDPDTADAAADPDGDGATNLQEFAAGTHPRGFHARYFAEGATSGFFDTRFALLAPNPDVDAHVLLRFLESTGRTTSLARIVPGLRRVTVSAREAFATASMEFGTVVESDQPIAVDRFMSWDAGGYGAHGETGDRVPGTAWYLAEGATMGGFELFYTLVNPGATPASARVRWMREAPASPVERDYVLDAYSRTTIWVNRIPGLEAAAASASVVSRNGVPILVERAMYRDGPGQTWGAGHGGAAAPAPALAWTFAEGATGDYFDTFLLLANPGATAAEVAATYRRSDGLVVLRTHRVEPFARLTVWVDREHPELADAALSTTIAVTNGVPIVAERVMWWPGTPDSWHEAHVSLGATATGTLWAVANGEVGGRSARDTYVLVGNAHAEAVEVRVTLAFDDGSREVRTFAVPPESRFTVDVGAEFDHARDRSFGVLVESTGQTPRGIVVETATYGSANGVEWASGAGSLATRVR